ncbi:hypothetical protein KKB99_07500 [bacterium]|nr:hypothetical protein [bacterium]MBU1025837.1 hypothetical protein [bacterium]
MKLKHAIGKSTLKEGFTIPKEFWLWVDAPEKGEKKTIALVFNDNQTKVTLRRLDNEYGHVQIKYYNQAGQVFKDWLNHIFKATLDKLCGEYFELEKLGQDQYKITPFPVCADLTPRLTTSQWLFHNVSEDQFEKETNLREISAVIRGVEITKNEGQSYYNKEFHLNFKAWGWETEKLVTPELGLKCDFIKDKTFVEVEFGNARSYYQDYIKFLIAYHNNLANIGVLIVPSASFAKQLCDVGRSRAIEKGKKYYSGMIDFEKVKREYKYVASFLNIPVTVIGVNYQ